MKIRKKLYSMALASIVLVSILILASSVVSAASVQDFASEFQKNAINQTDASPEFELAPLNPEFVNYTQHKIYNRNESSQNGYKTGFVPPPVDLSHLSNVSIRYVSAPVSYDLRALNKVTSVKDQGLKGSCWAFATFASLESCLMPEEIRDFSENNTLNLLSPTSPEGFDLTSDEGGNFLMSTAYLARWSGPVNETDDPYDPSDNISVYSPTGLQVQKHIKDVLIIPPRESPLDNDNIKTTVQQYGAVDTSMYYDFAYNSADGQYYFYNGAEASNHAVTIVGWDDSFDRNKFPIIPPGDGAFIVKNSWGTSFGDSGYFYVSYYDSKIGTSNAIFTAESPNNYDSIYQYDPLGWTDSLGYTSNPTTGWCANIFTARSNDTLKAVSFYTTDSNCNYEIYIYTDPTSYNPKSQSVPVLSQSGTFTFAGYHTVPLDSRVKLRTGQKFSVVLQLTTPEGYPIAIEEPISDYSSKATANAGQSFISSDGTDWADITTYFPNTNVCIKAVIDTILYPVADFTTNASRGFIPLTVQFTDNSVNADSWNWDFNSDGNVDSTQKNPVHTFEVAGTYTVNLTAINGNGTNSKLTSIRVLNESEPILPVADFTANRSEGYVPLTVQFTNSSDDATSLTWDFENDGIIDSTDENPVHTFETVGNYTVNLTASNENGTASKLATITAIHPVYAYIANYGSDTLSIIDTATKTVTATLPIVNGPFGVAVNPEGTKVYTANRDSNTVSVINTTTNIVTIIGVGNDPLGVAVSPDGKKAYVSNGDSDTVSVIDTATNAVVATVPVGIYPSGVAFTPDGTKVYVTSSAYNRYSKYNAIVSVIDTSTNIVTASVPVGAGSLGIVVSPDGTKAYVVNGYDNTVSVIDTKTNTVKSTVIVGRDPWGVAVSPDGKKVYVANSYSNTTSVIDTTTNTVVATVPVGYYPIGVSVNPKGNEAYVTNMGSNTVSIIDTATNRVKTTVSVGKTPVAFGQFIEQPVLPFANFNANPMSGYVPLSVQFTDLSKNAIEWSWNFGDGGTSTVQNPAHVYSAPGTYTVNLIIRNEDGTASKTATITVLQASSGGSGGGGGSKSSGGGGGSPEPASNVQVKELSQTQVTNGKSVKFDFTRNVTCVSSVTFDAKKTVGKTTGTVEMLKEKSTLVSPLSSGEIYKFFNLWIGNAGFATATNIANPVINFKVEKTWIKDKNIDSSSITLNRYSDKRWEQIPASLTGEDDKYLYFSAKTPGFSFFGITGKAKEAEIKPQQNNQQSNLGSEAPQKTATEQKTETSEKKIPGFEIVYGIAGLFTVLGYKRK